MKKRAAKKLFLLAAGASFVFSVSLWFAGYRDEGAFVGLWVPTILALGAFTFAFQRGGPECSSS